MRSLFRRRIRLVLAIILLVAVVILVRLYFIQIVHGSAYAEKADQQFSSGTRGIFDRGSIYFTSKDGTLISAATLATGFLVAINPQTLNDPARAYEAIVDTISTSGHIMSRDKFMSASKRKSQVYIEVARRVNEAEGRALAEQGIRGIHVLRERWRYYPGESLAAQTIGIVSYGDEYVREGRTGIEMYYEETLARSGDGLYRNFFAEIFSNVRNLLVSAREAREGDIVTTVEPFVQTRLEKNIISLNDRYNSIMSGGIIMDPRTGAILALATTPSYNPNDLRMVDPAVLGNPLVEHVYEFGSTIKPFTMAAALDKGVVTPTTTYNDTGCVVVNEARICNWDHKARGVVPMRNIVMRSLNVGAAWLATQLGQEAMRAYFTKFFGEKTGVDLPNETRALLGNLMKPQQVGFSTAAYGQGIAMTPMQMMRALSALANGGVMVEPHLVRSVRLESGIERSLPRSEGVSVLSPSAVNATTEMMVATMDEVLDGGRAKIPTMSVAAKTGTAQLIDGKGGYYKDRYFHSFIGYFPAYNPRFAILLYTNDPKGVTLASETLSEVFLDTVRFLISYYEVPPDRGITPIGAGAQDLRSLSQ